MTVNSTAAYITLRQTVRSGRGRCVAHALLLYPKFASLRIEGGALTRTGAAAKSAFLLVPKP